MHHRDSVHSPSSHHYNRNYNDGSYHQSTKNRADSRSDRLTVIQSISCWWVGIVSRIICVRICRGAVLHGEFCQVRSRTLYQSARNERCSYGIVDCPCLCVIWSVSASEIFGIIHVFGRGNGIWDEQVVQKCQPGDRNHRRISLRDRRRWRILRSRVIRNLNCGEIVASRRVDRVGTECQSDTSHGELSVIETVSGAVTCQDDEILHNLGIITITIACPLL